MINSHDVLHPFCMPPQARVRSIIKMKSHRFLKVQFQNFRNKWRLDEGMITLIFFSSMSLIVGWYAHIFWQADQLNAEQHPLAVVGRTAPFLSTLSLACPHWDMAFELQRKIQRDYCLRHFTGEPPRPKLTKGQLRGPNGESGSGPLMDFMIYKSADVISNAIQGGQSWELCNRRRRGTSALDKCLCG